MLTPEKLTVLLIYILLTGCIESQQDNPIITINDKTLSGNGFTYPKAHKKWDKYIGLYQKDAASIASRKEYWPDDNSITYLRSYAGVYSNDEHLGYVWKWTSKNRPIIFISGVIDDSGITNILIHNKNNLTVDEILMSFTSDENKTLLGNDEVDYFQHLWTDYTTESKGNLDTSVEYISVNENQVTDLLTYTDDLNCEQVYWKHGKRKGAKTQYFKQLIIDLTESVGTNNLKLFQKQLPEILNMECTTYFEQELYGLFFNYESKLKDNIKGSKKIFLQHMLNSGSSNTYSHNNFCETLSHGIFKQQKSPKRHESVELAELFLNYTITTNLQCSLFRSIRQSAQLNQTEFLSRLLKLEASNSSNEIQLNFQSTIVNGLESAAEDGNIEAFKLLKEYLSGEALSEYSTKQLLISVGKGGESEILDLFLNLKQKTDYSKYEVLEAALSTGNPAIVSKLFEMGFKLPKQSYVQESLVWSAYKYERSNPMKNPELLFQLLIDNGFEFINMEERDRFILMDRVYTFAQAAWVDSVTSVSAVRYKKAVLMLTKTYLNHTSSIDYQPGRMHQTLLMNAVDGNLPEVVELILKHKPNLSIKNKNDKTALDIATQEARIYILGSRKGFDVIYKKNAQKIVSLLGGDISPFDGMIK